MQRYGDNQIIRARCFGHAIVVLSIDYLMLGIRSFFSSMNIDSFIGGVGRFSVK